MLTPEQSRLQQQDYSEQNPAGNFAFGSSRMAITPFVANQAQPGQPWSFFLPARDDRRYFFIQNQSSTLSLYWTVDVLPNAVSGLIILPNGFYEPYIVPTNAIYVIANGPVSGIIIEG